MSHQRTADTARELVCAWVSELAVLDLSLIQQMDVLAAVAATLAKRAALQEPRILPEVAIDCAKGEFVRLMRIQRDRITRSSA